MKRFITFFKENKAALTGLGVVILVIMLAMSMSVTCPIKYLTGISCPGCGLTRAFLSILKLDFTSAFYYNPNWLVITLTGLFLIIFKLKNLKRASSITLAVFAVTVFAIYFFRMFSPYDTIVVFSPRSGAIFNFLSGWLGE